MLGLPRKTLVAIEAVLDIAYHAGGAPVQSGDITARQGIPRRSLEPILQQMTRAGLLTGVRGRAAAIVWCGSAAASPSAKSCGWSPAAKTLMGDVADASGSELGLRVVRPLWEDLGRDVMDQLDGLSLEDLCRRARDAGVAAQAEEAVDFTI